MGGSVYPWRRLFRVSNLMSAQTITRRLTQADLAKLYTAGEKVVMFTCYDASFARLLDGAGVECLLIGDSLGNVIQGHDTTLPVTVTDIAYHTACVKRGCDRPFIIADMPFGSYQESPEQAFRNAVTLMAAGAQMVKLEGGAEMAETVRFLVSRGIPVCGHVGLTPQSVHVLGGYKVQGKGEAAALRLKADAQALQDAGATMVVLDAFDIPPGKKAKFVKNFMEGATSLHDAACRAVAAVKSATYPGPEHTYAA